MCACLQNTHRTTYLQSKISLYMGGCVSVLGNPTLFHKKPQICGLWYPWKGLATSSRDTEGQLHFIFPSFLTDISF